MNFAAAWGAVSAYQRRLRLRIDSEGIRATVGGRTNHYLWQDIDRTRQVPKGRGSTVVQIIRKGQIYLDDETDLIWREFGLSDEELVSIIRAGQVRWGGGLLAEADKASVAR